MTYIKADTQTDGPMTYIKADTQTDGPGSLTNFGVLQERVANFDRRLGELAVSLDKTNAALDKATEAMSNLGKPQYSLWIATATFLVFMSGGLWAIAINPVNKDIERLYVANDKTILGMNNLSKLFDVELKAKLDRASVDDIRSDMKRKIDSLNDRIDEFNMRKKTTPQK